MVRKVIRILGILYLVYLALVLLLLLPALNTLPHWYVKETFGRELHTDLVLFNPFSLSLKVHRASLPEEDGTPFVALDEARVNLSLASLWRPGLVFDEVLVEQLYLHVSQVAPGRFNFSSLLEAIPPSEPSPEPEAEEGLPGLTVHRLHFGARRIALSDEAREEPFTTYYDGLDISVLELSTVLEEGKPYEISVVAEGGGELNWVGTVSIPQALSEGRLSVEGLSLVPFWRFAKPWLNLELQRGTLDLAGNYRLDWSETFSYAVTDGSLGLDDIAIIPLSPADLPDTEVALKAIALAGITVDSESQHAGIDSIQVNAPGITGWMEGETISLQEMFAVTLPETEPAGPPPAGPPPAQTGESPSPWTASVGEVRLSGGEIRWRSPFTEPAQLLVSPLDAHLEKLNWPLEGETGLGLALTVNGEASLQIDGALELDPGRGTLKYRLEELPLAWFNPNLPAPLHARITDGHAGIEGEVSLDGFVPSVIALSGSINKFAGEIKGEEQSVTSWKAVRLKDLLVKLDQREVSLAQVTIDSYEGRLHIAEDGSVNASKVWQAEVGDRAEDIAEDLELDQEWKFELPEILVTDSAIDFMDESLPIPFRTVIGDLHGEVLGISSDPGATAQVDMQGSVDGYAPVVLKGTARPLASPPALDLGLSFTGVDLSLLTPYSGTYMGYRIDRGLLNLELAYELDEGFLKGDNAVVINQLKLGEKVESDKALDLPLELALALLTDMNGVIDIAVPVSGSLEDPSFGLGSAIAGAFVNLITKAVTAPFSLLANLVGSEEDLQRMNFASGSAELLEVTQAKLDQLSEALLQRPGLTLVALGRINPEADLKQLQTVALQEDLIASGLTPAQVENREQAYVDSIESRYRKLGIQGELPSPIQQYDAVRQNFPVSDTALRELIEARAVAVKTYLVNTRGVSADRIAIEQSSPDDEAHQFSGVELDIDS